MAMSDLDFTHLSIHPSVILKCIAVHCSAQLVLVGSKKGPLIEGVNNGLVCSESQDIRYYGTTKSTHKSKSEAIHAFADI